MKALRELKVYITFRKRSELRFQVSAQVQEDLRRAVEPTWGNLSPIFWESGLSSVAREGLELGQVGGR